MATRKQINRFGLAAHATHKQGNHAKEFRDCRKAICLAAKRELKKMEKANG